MQGMSKRSRRLLQKVTAADDPPTEKRKRGRPRKVVTEDTASTPKRKRGRPRKVVTEDTASTPKRKRGRPRKVVTEDTASTPKRKRGRPRKVVTEDTASTPKRKRGRPRKHAVVSSSEEEEEESMSSVSTLEEEKQTSESSSSTVEESESSDVTLSPPPKRNRSRTRKNAGSSSANLQCLELSDLHNNVDDHAGFGAHIIEGKRGTWGRGAPHMLVQYPGHVVNDSRALATMHGVSNVARATLSDVKMDKKIPVSVSVDFQKMQGSNEKLYALSDFRPAGHGSDARACASLASTDKGSGEKGRASDSDDDVALMCARAAKTVPQLPLAGSVFFCPRPTFVVLLKGRPSALSAATTGNVSSLVERSAIDSSRPIDAEDLSIVGKLVVQCDFKCPSDFHMLRSADGSEDLVCTDGLSERGLCKASRAGELVKDIDRLSGMMDGSRRNTDLGARSKERGRNVDSCTESQVFTSFPVPRSHRHVLPETIPAAIAAVSAACGSTPAAKVAAESVHEDTVRDDRVAVGLTATQPESGAFALDGVAFPRPGRLYMPDASTSPARCRRGGGVSMKMTAGSLMYDSIGSQFFDAHWGAAEQQDVKQAKKGGVDYSHGAAVAAAAGPSVVLAAALKMALRSADDLISDFVG